VERNFKVRKRRPQLRQLRQAVGLGKFKSCLLQRWRTFITSLRRRGSCKMKDLPPRWGLLSLSEAGINVVVRSEWPGL